MKQLHVLKGEISLSPVRGPLKIRKKHGKFEPNAAFQCQMSEYLK